MAKRKVVKNPGSPGGRKDWEGRSPRRRMNFLHPDLKILLEWAKYFSIHNSGAYTTEHRELHERIANKERQIEKPLEKVVDGTGGDTSLLDIEI